ncbi:MAG: YgjV family protein [Clostridia bacterium]|nr:YgjV family protein [Clostridia bacterium]
MTTTEILGNALGVVAMVFGFCSFQAKTNKRLMVFQSLVCLFMGIHYVLLGSPSGCAMNMVGFVRNVVYYFSEDVKWLKNRAIPFVFTAVLGVMGYVFRESPYAFLMIAGLVINSLCLSLQNPHLVRKSILLTSTMVLIYDILLPSVSGAVYESIAIISSVIGLVRYRKKKQITE